MHPVCTTCGGALTQDRSQRQLAQQRILNSLAQAISSGLDQQLVLNRLTEAAVYLVDADEGSLLLRSKESGQIQIRARLTENERHAQPETLLVQDRLAQQVLESGEPLILSGHDLDAHRQMAGLKTHPLVTLVDVPIKIQGRPVGILRAVRYGHRDFTPDDLSMLAPLANYAALAVENMGLRDEIQEKTERMAICEIGASFSSTLRLDTVLEMIMQVAMRIIDAERGYIALLDQENGAPISREIHVAGRTISKALELPFGGNVVRQVLASGEPIHLDRAHRGHARRPDGKPGGDVYAGWRTRGHRRRDLCGPQRQPVL